MFRYSRLLKPTLVTAASLPIAYHLFFKQKPLPISTLYPLPDTKSIESALGLTGNGFKLYTYRQSFKGSRVQLRSITPPLIFDKITNYVSDTGGYVVIDKAAPEAQRKSQMIALDSRPWYKRLKPFKIDTHKKIFWLPDVYIKVSEFKAYLEGSLSSYSTLSPLYRSLLDDKDIRKHIESIQYWGETELKIHCENFWDSHKKIKDIQSLLSKKGIKSTNEGRDRCCSGNVFRIVVLAANEFNQFVLEENQIVDRANSILKRG